jgi:hypothetical protein
MVQRRRILQCLSAAGICAIAHQLLAAASTHAVKRLLFIHGRSQQGHDPKKLEDSWMSALRRGASNAHIPMPEIKGVSFPFYGNQLNDFEKAGDIPLTSDVHARGELDDGYADFQVEVAEEIREKAGITEAEIDAEYRGGPEERGPLNWPWVQALLRVIDKHAGRASDRSIELFTRDVWLYCRRAGVRDAINRIVAAQLTEEPTVVVAHSLGTVVGYSVLSTDTRTLNVPLLVTVGSPLGIRAIRNQLVPLHMPDCVKNWYNAFDTRDVVALYPLDASNFPIQPPIENNNSVKNGTDNRHGIHGYLDDKNVAARILSEWL